MPHPNWRKHHAPSELQKELAQALGYTNYPQTRDAEPHLNYIQQACLGKYDAKEYLDFIIHVIKHFTQDNPSTNEGPQSDLIQDLLQNLAKDGYLQIFKDTASDPEKRRTEVEDHVMGILGRWTMLLSHFQPRSGLRPLLTAYQKHSGQSNHVSAYTQNLASLVQGSRVLGSGENPPLSHLAHIQSEIVKTAISLVNLVSGFNSSTNNAAANHGSIQGSSAMSNSFGTYNPTYDMDLESLNIDSRKLNAFILYTDAAVDISWTKNLSKHMILTPSNGRRHMLKVFAMPCIFESTHGMAQTIGLPSKLANEIKCSYAMLFNAWSKDPRHVRRLRFFGIRKICWCWSCSAFRYRISMLRAYEKWCNDKQRKSETFNGETLSLIDGSIAKLAIKEPLDEWNKSMFPHLWSRIAQVHQHQLTTKPWSIWMLFRDRRDTLQYWTFL